LVIGLNSDASVKRLKGDNRPIVPEQWRARLLAALGVLDSVALFDEDTPEQLIHDIRPDLLVKGADYEIEEIAGSDFVLKSGGRVETIHLVPGLSSSDLIRKIVDVYGTTNRAGD